MIALLSSAALAADVDSIVLHRSGGMDRDALSYELAITPTHATWTRKGRPTDTSTALLSDGVFADIAGFLSERSAFAAPDPLLGRPVGMDGGAFHLVLDGDEPRELTWDTGRSFATRRVLHPWLEGVAATWTWDRPEVPTFLAPRSPDEAKQRVLAQEALTKVLLAVHSDLRACRPDPESGWVDDGIPQLLVRVNTSGSVALTDAERAPEAQVACLKAVLVDVEVSPAPPSIVVLEHP